MSKLWKSSRSSKLRCWVRDATFLWFIVIITVKLHLIFRSTAQTQTTITVKFSIITLGKFTKHLELHSKIHKNHCFQFRLYAKYNDTCSVCTQQMHCMYTTFALISAVKKWLRDAHILCINTVHAMYMHCICSAYTLSDHEQ